MGVTGLTKYLAKYNCSVAWAEFAAPEGAVVLVDASLVLFKHLAAADGPDMVRERTADLWRAMALRGAGRVELFFDHGAPAAKDPERAKRRVEGAVAVANLYAWASPSGCVVDVEGAKPGSFRAWLQSALRGPDLLRKLQPHIGAWLCGAAPACAAYADGVVRAAEEPLDNATGRGPLGLPFGLREHAAEPRCVAWRDGAWADAGPATAGEADAKITAALRAHAAAAAAVVVRSDDSDLLLRAMLAARTPGAPIFVMTSERVYDVRALAAAVERTASLRTFALLALLGGSDYTETLLSVASETARLLHLDAMLAVHAAAPARLDAALRGPGVDEAAVGRFLTAALHAHGHVEAARAAYADEGAPLPRRVAQVRRQVARRAVLTPTDAILAGVPAAVRRAHWALRYFEGAAPADCVTDGPEGAWGWIRVDGIVAAARAVTALPPE